MRKKLIGFLLVPVLLLAIVSCDGDIFGTISDFMGQTGANVYVDGGLVQVDTSQGATVSNTLSDIQSATVPDKDTDPDGFDEYIEEYKEQVQTTKTVIVEALNSETKKAALVVAMSEPLPSTPTLPPRVEDAIAAIEDTTNGLGIDIDTDAIETEGDLLALILIAELYHNVSDAIDAAGGDVGDLTDEQALALVSEAQQVIEIVRTISPVGSVTLDDILGQLIGDQALLDQLFRGTARSTTREGEDDFDPSTILEPIFNTIINAIGTEVTSEGRVIISSGLRRMQTNFSMMRIAYEQMAPSLQKSGKALELTDVINYALSVIFTESDGFLSTVGSGDITFEDAINDVIAWIDAGKPEEEGPEILSSIDWGVEFEEFMEISDNATKFGENGKIFTTIRQLATAVPDGGFIIDGIDQLFSEE